MDNNIMTVHQFVESYEAFTEATVRWWIFNAKDNNFKICIIRIGGRVYIDGDKFKEWFESHRVVPMEYMVQTQDS